ncbi:hypothetical protein COT97_00260 [Candidatus Falkowbacteria bacterium CG10_big_fil_rev_8_21_14_0_10_39_11]|uniref:CDP-diacylglycerol--glycerol-3-phosphate 3-phosphatidyltransferase n=1 Tax=Candidatus Falkowbacteria bacterium CG10_big_fil_rev_8_21_14_0_10_39_11 TaxID=1974565 RepID=A0A2H0V8I8_9BACT|nr:MAG: hypothetical protein COT97_00260 [Candidatus Falkowbacteria bacterium CG10_big_fil_rev_8_21_14_0_10_39_11]
MFEKIRRSMENFFDPFCRIFFPIIPIWVTPNRLTIARLIGVPFLIYILWQGWYISSLVLFITLALTDMFDGALARGRNMITEFGTLLDPISDKILIASASLILLIKVDLTLAILIVGLDLIVLILSGVGKLIGHKLNLKANIWGKTKLTLQVIGIGLIFLGFILNLMWLHDVAIYVLWAAVAFAIVSIIKNGA